MELGFSYYCLSVEANNRQQHYLGILFIISNLSAAYIVYFPLTSSSSSKLIFSHFAYSASVHVIPLLSLSADPTRGGHLAHMVWSRGQRGLKAKLFGLGLGLSFLVFGLGLMWSLFHENWPAWLPWKFSAYVSLFHPRLKMYLFQ